MSSSIVNNQISITASDISSLMVSEAKKRAEDALKPIRKENANCAEKIDSLLSTLSASIRDAYFEHYDVKALKLAEAYSELTDYKVTIIPDFIIDYCERFCRVSGSDEDVDIGFLRDFKFRYTNWEADYERKGSYFSINTFTVGMIFADKNAVQKIRDFYFFKIGKNEKKISFYDDINEINSLIGIIQDTELDFVIPEMSIDMSLIENGIELRNKINELWKEKCALVERIKEVENKFKCDKDGNSPIEADIRNRITKASLSTNPLLERTFDIGKLMEGFKLLENE